jgi:curved DNA-binding protein CbpA
MVTPGDGQDRLDLLDYYTLLGLEPDASMDDIRRAFHTFALKYHPDRHVGGTDAKLGRASQIFRRGAEAYRVLTDPEARRRYDEQLRLGKLRYDPNVEDLRRSKRPGSGVLAVHSPKARPFFQKADAAIRAKDWNTAKLNLRIALSHEPGNELIEARLAMVEIELQKPKK